MQLELVDRGSMQRLVEKLAEQRHALASNPHSGQTRRRLARWGSFAATVRAGYLPESLLWRFAGGVARALQHMHEAGYLYLDVKPANALVTRRGQVKLGDFGLASPFTRQAARQATPCAVPAQAAPAPRQGGSAASRRLGFDGGGSGATPPTDLSAAALGATGVESPPRQAPDDAAAADGTGFVDSDDEEGDVQYMAPELLQRGGHQPPADLFSLGMSLLQLGWGMTLPRSGPTWHALRRGQVPPPPPAAGRSPALVQLVTSLLSPDPKQRPSAAAVASMPQAAVADCTTDDPFLAVFDAVKAPGDTSEDGEPCNRAQLGRSASLTGAEALRINQELAQSAQPPPPAAAEPVPVPVSGVSASLTTTPFKVPMGGVGGAAECDAGGAPARPPPRARGYLRTRGGEVVPPTPLPFPLHGTSTRQGTGVPTPTIQRAVQPAAGPVPPTPARHRPSQPVEPGAPRGGGPISISATADTPMAAVAGPLRFTAVTPGGGCLAPPTPSTGRAGRVWGGAPTPARRLSGIVEEEQEEGFTPAQRRSSACGSTLSRARSVSASASPGRPSADHSWGSCDTTPPLAAPSPIAAGDGSSPTELLGPGVTPFTRAPGASRKTRARTSGCLTPPLDDSADGDGMVESAAKRMALMELTAAAEDKFVAVNRGVMPPRQSVPVTTQAPPAPPSPPPSTGRKRGSAHMYTSHPPTARVAASLFQEQAPPLDTSEDDVSLAHDGAGDRGLHIDTAHAQPGPASTAASASGSGGDGGPTSTTSRAGSRSSLDSLNSNVAAQLAAGGFTVSALRIPTPSSAAAAAALHTPSPEVDGYATPLAQGTLGKYHWAN